MSRLDGLPLQIRTAQSISNFKSLLKTHLFALVSHSSWALYSASAFLFSLVFFEFDLIFLWNILNLLFFVYMTLGNVGHLKCVLYINK